MKGECNYPAWEPRLLDDGKVQSSDCGAPATVAAVRDDTGRPWRLACAGHARYYPSAVPIEEVEEP